MVRYGDLGSNMLISYRIQAYKKAGLIMGRSGMGTGVERGLTNAKPQFKCRYFFGMFIYLAGN